jgi:hypothetical protein
VLVGKCAERVVVSKININFSYGKDVTQSGEQWKLEDNFSDLSSDIYYNGVDV